MQITTHNRRPIILAIATLLVSLFTALPLSAAEPLATFEAVERLGIAIPLDDKAVPGPRYGACVC